MDKKEDFFRHKEKIKGTIQNSFENFMDFFIVTFFQMWRRKMDFTNIGK